MHKILIAFLTLFVLFSSCNLPQGDKHFISGAKFYDSGDFDSAIPELKLAIEKGLSLYEEDEVFTVIGNAFNELEKYDSSLFYHDRALDINPKNHEAWTNKGITYRLLTEYDLAEECYRNALALKPDYAELHASLGALYIYQEEVDLAIEHLTKAVKLDKMLPVSHSNLSYALALKGKFQEAEKELLIAESLGYKNGDIIRERIKEIKEPKEEE